MIRNRGEDIAFLKEDRDKTNRAIMEQEERLNEWIEKVKRLLGVTNEQ